MLRAVQTLRTRFSPSAATQRIWPERPSKNKSAPSSLRPGSDTKQNKEHLAHSDLAPDTK